MTHRFGGQSKCVLQNDTDTDFISSEPSIGPDTSENSRLSNLETDSRFGFMAKRSTVVPRLCRAPEREDLPEFIRNLLLLLQTLGEQLEFVSGEATGLRLPPTTVIDLRFVADS